MVDIELEHYGMGLHKVHVNSVSGLVPLSRTRRRLLSVDKEDYRDIYGYNPFMRGHECPYENVKGGILPWSTVVDRKMPKETEAVAEDLERLADAVVAGEVRPPFGPEDRRALYDSEDEYLAAVAEQDSGLELEYRGDALVASWERFGILREYFFEVEERPSEADGRLTYLGTAKREGEDVTYSMTDRLPRRISGPLREMGYDDVEQGEDTIREVKLRDMGADNVRDSDALRELIDAFE